MIYVNYFHSLLIFAIIMIMIIDYGAIILEKIEKQISNFMAVLVIKKIKTIIMFHKRNILICLLFP